MRARIIEMRRPRNGDNIKGNQFRDRHDKLNWDRCLFLMGKVENFAF